MSTMNDHLARLASSTPETRDDALAALRGQLTAAGGPLTEPVSDDPGSLRYTFVWFGDQGPVSVRCELFSGRYAFARAPMTRLAGTDVWFVDAIGARDVLTAYQFLIDDPLAGIDEEKLPALVTDPEFPQLVQAMTMRSFADPFNTQSLISGAVLANPELDRADRTRWDSLLVGPDAAYLAADFEPAAGAGTLHSHQVRSAAFDNERTVEVYTPPGYDAAGGPYPLVLLLDGDSWTTAGAIPHALDNLIAQGAIPPLLAAFVHNPTDMSRMDEMACNPLLVTHLADELLPFLRAEYPITADPREVVLGGCSFAGLASSYVAFQRPDVVGNAISGSGSHGWCPSQGGMPESPELPDPSTPVDPSDDENQPGWLLRQIERADRRAVRFWIHVGRLETDMLPWSKRFRDVLTSKGYDVTYEEPCGGHEMGSMRVATVRAIVGLLGKQS